LRRDAETLIMRLEHEKTKRRAAEALGRYVEATRQRSDRRNPRRIKNSKFPFWKPETPTAHCFTHKVCLFLIFYLHGIIPKKKLL
jgi:hypothetical protein